MNFQRNSTNQTSSSSISNFGQLLLIALIEAVFVSLLSGPVEHRHYYHYPATETATPEELPMCILPEPQQQDTRHRA